MSVPVVQLCIWDNTHLYVLAPVIPQTHVFRTMNFDFFSLFPHVILQLLISPDNRYEFY